jgi:hypothetical protein
MRKIKIFLTTLAVAGVLFATSSCVDNTESESVANLRDAKAAELLANAQALKDWAAADKIRAEGEAALNKAKAETEAAIADYQRALGNAAEKEAEAKEIEAKAKLLLAQADTIRAAGEKALALAQAQHYLAQAEKTRLEAEAAANTAAENLRVTIARNNYTIAQQESLLAQQEIQAKLDLLDKQKLALEAAAKLEIASAVEYARLVDLLNERLQTITTQQGLIDSYELAIAKIELELATYEINSEAFVSKFIAEAEATITKSNLALKYAQKDLEFWESADPSENLKARKDELIKDTLETYNTLEEVKATVATELAQLEADTVVTYEAKVAANEAYNAATNEYSDASAAVETAQAKLDAYNVVAGSVSYEIDNSAIYNQGWTSLPEVPADIDLPTNKGTYTLSQLNLISASNYPSYEYRRYNLYDEPNVYISLYSYRGLDSYGETSYFEYYWEYYNYKISSSNVDTKYPTVDALLHDIRYKRDDIVDKEKTLADANKALEYATDSLKIYSDSVYKTDKEKAAAEKVKTAAETAKTAAETAYTEGGTVYNTAWAAYTAKEILGTQTREDSIALETAAKVYNWEHPFDPNPNRPFTGTNTSLLKKLQDATTASEDAVNALTDATTVYTGALAKFNAYRNTIVRNAIQSVINADGSLIQAKTELAKLESLEEVLKTGTREKLVFALADATKTLDDLLNSDAYKDAITDNTVANSAHAEKVVAYYSFDYTDLELAQAAYDLAKETYAEVEVIDAELALGGPQTLQDEKADEIAEAKAEIARLETLIKYTEEQLKDVTNYAKDQYTQVIATVIANYQTSIAQKEDAIKTAETAIAKAEKEAEYYDAAIKAFLKALGE